MGSRNSTAMPWFAARLVRVQLTDTNAYAWPDNFRRKANPAAVCSVPMLPVIAEVLDESGCMPALGMWTVRCPLGFVA